MSVRQRSLLLLTAACAIALTIAQAVAAQDVVTVGTVIATGTTVDVPVYIRDASGTPLGIDKPAGSKIQSFSIKVNYSPASSVQSVSFSRDGITEGLTPTSEFKPTGPGTVSLLATFQESTNPIPFTLNAGAPGDLVAHLFVTLAPSASPGGSITLTLDPTLTQLTDQGGTAATKETEGNGALSLDDGAINIPQLTVSLEPQSIDVPLGGTELLTASTNLVVAGNTSVALSSSNPAFATVPASVNILAGQNSATFSVSGIALGTTTISATLGSSTDTATVTVNDCPVMATPVIIGPGEAGIGATYTISWTAVENATDYQIEESTKSNFQGATSRVITATSSSYTHDVLGLRYYYRVRAHHSEGNCDVLSLYSAPISVVITNVVAPKARILAVVGSLPGALGSNFRTSLSLFNPKETAISGRIVFHPQGAAGTTTDPSLPYSIAARKTLSYADLLPAMGVPSGIGSADLIADGTSAFPVVLARVFDDAGEAGTTGFAEELQAPDLALIAGSSGALIAPADIQKHRLNIGIRTLEAGAAMTITVRDALGAVLKSVTKSYAPTWFIQEPSAVMLDGFALVGGETITFAVTGGSAFVYGATTDNTTNDPSVQFARRIE